MDFDQKKTALRMIPYGLYILTAANKADEICAATVNWVTQASFQPPLAAVGVKADSAAHRLIKESGAFALNILIKGQQSLAFTFFKPAVKKGQTISGESYRNGKTGSPLLTKAAAFVDCKLVGAIEKGDHSVIVGEVVDAGAAQLPEGRPDDATLWLKDLGEKVFYGG